MTADLARLSAFSFRDTGGNPAGVVFLTDFPDDAEMRRVAADIGYSETAFLVPDGDAWRVRYFAPATEIAFCGHATIALGAELGARRGAGVYRLKLNDAEITVEAAESNGGWSAALISPSTWSKPMDADLKRRLLDAFALTDADLDVSVPPSLAHAGATHGVLALRDRARLASMTYDFEPMKALMQDADLTTVSLIVVESPALIHSRNAFAVGGIVEDPATGAAAAALGGLLRDLGRLDFAGGTAEFRVHQGDDMGVPSRLDVRVGAEAGSPVRVAGTVRRLA